MIAKEKAAMGQMKWLSSEWDWVQPNDRKKKQTSKNLCPWVSITYNFLVVYTLILFKIKNLCVYIYILHSQLCSKAHLWPLFTISFALVLFSIPQSHSHNAYTNTHICISRMLYAHELLSSLFFSSERTDIKYSLFTRHQYYCHHHCQPQQQTANIHGKWRENDGERKMEYSVDFIHHSA